MGDRGNVFVLQRSWDKTDVRGVCLYTHWGGTELRATLDAALVRGAGRIGDQSYLTRIIFSEMVSHDVMGTTGYGIDLFSTPDNEHDVLVVEAWSGKVFTLPANGSSVEEVLDWHAQLAGVDA